jgi:hypothetical protein
MAKKKAKAGLEADGKLHELYDYGGDEAVYYATDKNWIAGLDDDADTQLALIFEALNLEEATGEDQHGYPWVLTASIVPAYPGQKWMDKASASGAGDGIDDPVTALESSYQYGGGIPVTHDLLEIKGGGSDLNKFDRKQVQWRKSKETFGTVAAQRGPGTVFEYPMFAESDDAIAFAKELLKRAPALFGLIGFFLDRPINMAGETGWDTLRSQTE